MTYLGFIAASVPPQRVADQIDEILERPEFRDDRGWLERLGEWINPLELIGRAVDWVASALTGSAGGLGLFLGWGFVVVVVLATVFLVVRLMADSSLGAIINEKASTRHQVSADELVAQARDLERLGSWREAIRARHAAVIAQLGEQGLVRRRAGTTAREYWFQLSANAPRASEVFGTVTSEFERVWYGLESADGDASTQFRQNCEKTLQMVKQ